MQPRRLWMAVAIGFGLLATAPYRILAFPPPFLEEASTTFRTAADELGENVQNPPPEYLFISGAHHTAHNPDEGGHPPQQAITILHPHQHPPHPPQPTAQYYPPHGYHFPSGAGTGDAHNPNEGGYPPQQAITILHPHHYPHHPAQPTAQYYSPQEHRFFSGAGTGDAHNPYQSNNPPQYAPDPIYWRPEPQHAAQQYAAPWHQQLGPAQGQGYPHHPGAPAVHPDYSAANLVRLAVQHLSLVQQEPGTRFRASLFGQAQGHGATSTFYPSSGAINREGGSFTPSGWPHAQEAQHHLPVAESDELVGSEYGANYRPPKFIVDLKTMANEMDKASPFTLAHINRFPDDFRPIITNWILATDDQRSIVKDLLQKRFVGTNVEIYMPETARTSARQDRTRTINRCPSLFREPKSLEWELIGYNGRWFFFELGDFRFRIHDTLEDEKPSRDSPVLILKIIGANMREPSRKPFLYIGNTKVIRKTFNVEREQSQERLGKQNLDIDRIGLVDIHGSRGRNGKQPEQQQQLEQLEQPQQAINNNRKKSRKESRKGKELQQ